MKILLIAGHGAGDPGASGCGYREANLTRELVNLIAPKLRKYAIVDVYNETAAHSMMYRTVHSKSESTIMCWKYISMHSMDLDTVQKSL